MAEQNAQIFVPFTQSVYVEDHVDEEWLDLVQKVQHLVVKISENENIFFSLFDFNTNPIVSCLNVFMFSGI